MNAVSIDGKANAIHGTVDEAQPAGGGAVGIATKLAPSEVIADVVGVSGSHEIGAAYTGSA